MNKKTFWIGYVIGFILTVGGIYVVIKKFQHQSTPDIAIEKIQMKDLNGNSVNVSDFSGKPLVINYWATWCAPCREEFPDFEKAKQDFGDKANFVMVSDETVEKILSFKKQNTYSFTFLQSSRPLSESGINVRPTTYFYNSKGILTTKKIGGLDTKELSEILDNNLK